MRTASTKLNNTKVEFYCIIADIKRIIAKLFSTIWVSHYCLLGDPTKRSNYFWAPSITITIILGFGFDWQNVALNFTNQREKMFLVSELHMIGDKRGREWGEGEE